jgi:A/G-specific adenine glycosylase
VLTRVLGFDGDLAQASQQRALWSAAEALLPSRGIEALCSSPTAAMTR